MVLAAILGEAGEKTHPVAAPELAELLKSEASIPLAPLENCRVKV